MFSETNLRFCLQPPKNRSPSKIVMLIIKNYLKGGEERRNEEIKYSNSQLNCQPGRCQCYGVIPFFMFKKKNMYIPQNRFLWFLKGRITSLWGKKTTIL